MSVDRQNYAVFERRDVVEWYATRDALQGGEDAVLQELSPQLETMAMLDVGVGGGRTTVHFAPRVKRYVGIDYAPSMIEACKRRCGEMAGIELSVADARELSYESESFDFVLFSHCGIDYVTHEDRLRILGELRRVLRRGGHFSFSTHNLQRVRTLLVGRDGEGFLSRVWKAPTRLRLRGTNAPLAELEASEHALLNDGAFRGGARTYHIRARAEVEQLERAGFGGVRVMSAATGKALDLEAASRSDEPWLSYVAMGA